MYRVFIVRVRNKDLNIIKTSSTRLISVGSVFKSFKLHLLGCMILHC